MMMRSIRMGSLVLAVVAAASPLLAGQIDDLVKQTKQMLGRAPAEEKLIAYFHIDGALAETPTELPPLFGDKPPLSLKVLLERLKEARQDPSVVAVMLDVQGASLGTGQLEEIHESLRKFTAVDKDVYVHADSLQTGTYIAATAASHISVVPTGDVWLTGLYSESPFFRGALDKLGIVPDMEHCGDFKTGAEFITRTGPSDESKKMNKWLLDSLFDSMVDRIAKSRKMTPQKVRQLIDNGPYTAEEALQAGLIDSVKQRQDFASHLWDKYGRSVRIASDYGDKSKEDMPEDFFAMMTWLMEIMNPSPKVYTEPSVAIVYVEGMIQTGSAPSSPFGSSEGAYSTTIRKALDKAAEDESVRTVVLRVDSPGGSALASEIIWDATRRVAAKKPFVVSMGNVAGSGGYYVSCGAETIFADAMTITSSIGVLGGKLVTTAAWEKLGVNWHGSERGENAGMMSSSAPFNEKERAKIRHYMDSVYGTFKQRVVDGRKGKLTKPIDELAGGRVFTGQQALELGLVDQIGGLDDAIKYAAGRAKLSEYDIRVIPEPPSILQLFMHQDSGDESLQLGGVPNPLIQKSAGSRWRGQEVGRLLARLAPLADFNGLNAMLPGLTSLDPHRVKIALQMLRSLTILNEESVVTFMPVSIGTR